MRAVIINAPKQIETNTWDSPKPKPGEVLIAVAAAGICAGDMYFFLGKNPYAVYPQICGHEVAGTIVELGDNVDSVKVGDRVAVEPFISCGHCYPCRVGKSNCCINLRIIGVHSPGGYAELVVAPATHVHKLPSELSLIDATFAEPVAVAVQACRRADVKDELVLVLGCGPIGLALIEVARAKGAEVIATDVVESRTKTAFDLGAEIVPAGDQLIETIRQRTNNEGVPIVIEATGNPRAMEMTADLVAEGGRICIVGLVPEGITVKFPGLYFTRKEMTIVGSRASVDCFPEALELLVSGKIQYPKVASLFDMWDAPEIFQQLAVQPDYVSKGVLTIRDEGS